MRNGEFPFYFSRLPDDRRAGNDSWRFKSRDDDHAARARHVSATPASSDEASATAKTRRSKGSKPKHITMQQPIGGSAPFQKSRQGAQDRKIQKMPFRTRRSFTRGTPHGLFGSIGLIAAHASSVSS
jgi:hypothetical protein